MKKITKKDLLHKSEYICQHDIRYSIFNEAAAEVLQVLQERCEMAFQASPAYEVLLRKAEKDEAEMAALGKVSHNDNHNRV